MAMAAILKTVKLPYLYKPLTNFGKVTHTGALYR